MNKPSAEKASERNSPKPSRWTKLRDLFATKSAHPDKQENEKQSVADLAAGVEPTQATVLMKGAADAKPEPADKPAGQAAHSVTVEGEAPSSSAAPGALPIVVRFSQVTKTFGQGPAAQVALTDVTFTVEDLPDTGELISIVGPSGCGKSTLLRMIAGLQPHYPQTSGVIEVLGRTTDLLPSSERGLVDQKYSLFPHLTVRQNIMFGLDIRGESRSTRGDKADIWIKKVGLEGAADKYPQELSGGMQQRVAIAATLVLGPRILLMDEPFGALDPKTRLKMQELLVELWNEQQSTVFIVTHSVDEAIYLGDRVFRMGARPGRLMEIMQAPRPDMPPEEMRQKKWFIDMTRDLLNRLEQDKLATGELSSYSEFVKERNLRHSKPLS